MQASIVQNATHSLVYFKYEIPGGQTQEQWAVHVAGGRAVTIGKNSTVGSPHASSCTVVKDEDARDDNNPRFCSETAQIHLRYRRDVHFGVDGRGEEWVFTRGTRVENATLSVVVQEVPAVAVCAPGDAACADTRWQASAEGWRTVLPVWHRFGPAPPDHAPPVPDSYSVDHVMLDASAAVDESVFLRMPLGASCAPADSGRDVREGDDGDADIRRRAAQRSPRTGGLASALPRRRSGEGWRHSAIAAGEGGGGCPFGFSRQHSVDGDVTALDVDADGGQHASSSVQSVLSKWLNRFAADLPFGFDAWSTSEPESDAASAASSDDADATEDEQDEDAEAWAAAEAAAEEEHRARLTARWTKVRGGIEAVVTRAARWWHGAAAHMHHQHHAHPGATA